jgi:hypothetical protein
LFIEAYELSRRHVEFDVAGLFEAAVKAADGAASKCIRAIKLPRGNYNKEFRLELDNREHVIAKIPNPNAGPQFYTLASEVATLDYVRTNLILPVPRVLDWSPTADTEVKAEYIITEPLLG